LIVRQVAGLETLMRAVKGLRVTIFVSSKVKRQKALEYVRGPSQEGATKIGFNLLYYGILAALV
jgi:hypothetical protein